MSKVTLYFRPVSIIATAILAISLGTFGAHAQSQDTQRLEPSVRFTHLTSDDGLAQNTIQAILQDSRGFMWFGTPNGLSRYDGYRFITYQSDPQNKNPNSLSHNDVRALLEDKDGMIWIATHGGGADKFDPQTQTFTRYLPDPKNPNTIGGDQLFTVFQDSDGNLWFGGTPQTGITRFNPKTQVFTRIPSDPAIPDSFHGKSVWRFLQTDPKSLWMTGDGVLAKLDLATGHFFNYTSSDGDVGRWPVLHQDSTGALWVGGQHGLHKFDAASGSFTDYPAPAGVNDLLEAGSNQFWVGSVGGLYRFNSLTGQAPAPFQHLRSESESLSDTNITVVYQDRSGILWIGTNAGGVNIYDPRQTQFAYYQFDATAKTNQTASLVGSIYAAQDNVWVALGSSVDDLNLSTGQVTSFTPELASDPSFAITAVYQDRTGVVWIGASNFRLLTLDPATGQFSSFPLISQSPRGPPGPPSAIVAIHEDAQGALWLASDQDGLYELDSKRENVQYYPSPFPPAPPNAGGGTPVTPNAPPTGLRAPITNIYFDQAGTIWVGTWNGVSRFDPHTKQFKQYRAKKSDVPGPDSWIEAVIEDHNGLIWMASHDGLIQLDPITGITKYYTDKEGLPSNVLVGILQDQAGNLWISSKKGISKFAPLTETFHNYDVSDGLQGNEFDSSAFAQTANGQMFFGGPNGLTAFTPDQITDNPYPPAVVLTDFQLFNKSVLPGPNAPLTYPIWATKALTLNYDQDFFSFEFAALSYAASYKNQFRYRLDGFDQTWNFTDSSRRFATYTNLSAGTYVFRVEAANNNGLWSTQEATLTLTVLPPWWETTAFRGAIALLLGSLLWSGYRWRLYAIQQRNRNLEQLVVERTHALQSRTLELQAREEQLSQARDAAEIANRAKSTFLANMSHELRTPLNVILGFAQIMRRNAPISGDIQENLHMILQSGEHLLALINEVLDLSKIEAGRMALNLTSFDLYRLLDDLEDMFSLKAADKQLQLLIEHSPDLPHYIRTDELKLRQVLINLISNALKFTTEGGITVRAMQLNAGNDTAPSACDLKWEIEDTGPGIPPSEIATLFEAFTQTATGRQSQEGTGLGLPISRKFIQLMGGDITVKSQVQQRTIFGFTIHCQIAEATETQAARVRQQIIGLAEGQPRYRILITDDRWMNRQLLVKLLGPLGFELREAENGKEAVEISAIFNPQLIFMDMRMPVMDGYEAVRLIKSAAQDQSKVVVIALTASAFEEERTAILAAGCDDFLRKPFRTEVLLDMIAKYLGLQYTYVNDQEQSATLSDSAQVQQELTRDALKVLPAKMLAQLTEGVELGDIGLINKTIAEIRVDHRPLAEAIARLAHRFDYEKLLSLLQETIQ